MQPVLVKYTHTLVYICNITSVSVPSAVTIIMYSLCYINKHCFVGSFVFSFFPPFPTYPCAIQTLITAVFYLALQT